MRVLRSLTGYSFEVFDGYVVINVAWSCLGAGFQIQGVTNAKSGQRAVMLEVFLPFVEIIIAVPF